MYLYLEKKKTGSYYHTLSEPLFFPPLHLVFSDHKVSSDITQSISRQGRENVYGVKYIHNVKFSLFKQLWSGEDHANQTLWYLKIRATWHSGFHCSETIPLLLLQEHCSAQERETDLSCLTSPVLPQAVGKEKPILWSPIYHSYFHSHKLLLRP